MTREELIIGIHRLFTPNFIKRKQIRPLLAEYNSRTELRNKAYPKADPWPTILDTLEFQNSASLDKTFDFLSEQIEPDWHSTAHGYWELINENEEKEARRIANEKAEALLTINLKEEKEMK